MPLNLDYRRSRLISFAWRLGAGANIPIAIGLIALLPYIGNRSIDADEGFSIAFARLDWQTLRIALTHLDAVFAAFYSVLHVWRLMGDGAGTLRGLSVLATLVSIPLMYAVTEHLFNRTAAFVAATVFATNPFVVTYAHDIRPYALAVTFALAATLFFLRLISNPTTRNVVAYAMFAILTVVMHAFVGLVLLSHLVSLTVLERAPGATRLVAIAFAIIALGLMPLTVLVYHVGAEQINWIQVPQMREFFLSLTGGQIGERTVILALIVLFVTMRARHAERAVLATVIWLIVPLLVLLVVTHTVRPIFISRYAIWSAVPLAILVGAGIASLGRPLFIATVSVFVVANAISLDWSGGRYDGENFRAAVGYIASHATLDDAFVASQDDFLAVRFARDEHPNVPFPPELYPGNAVSIWNRKAIGGEVDAVGPRRIWLIERGMMIRNNRYKSPDLIIEEHLKRRRTIVARESFGGIRVIEFGPANQDSARRLSQPASRASAVSYPTTVVTLDFLRRCSKRTRSSLLPIVCSRAPRALGERRIECCAPTRVVARRSHRLTRSRVFFRALH